MHAAPTLTVTHVNQPQLSSGNGYKNIAADVFVDAKSRTQHNNNMYRRTAIMLKRHEIRHMYFNYVPLTFPSSALWFKYNGFGLRLYFRPATIEIVRATDFNNLPWMRLWKWPTALSYKFWASIRSTMLLYNKFGFSEPSNLRRMTWCQKVEGGLEGNIKWIMNGNVTTSNCRVDQILLIKSLKKWGQPVWLNQHQVDNTLVLWKSSLRCWGKAYTPSLITHASRRHYWLLQASSNDWEADLIVK